jgi:hypothetical protein
MKRNHLAHYSSDCDMKVINAVICVLVILLHHQAQAGKADVSTGYINTYHPSANFILLVICMIFVTTNSGIYGYRKTTIFR